MSIPTIRSRSYVLNNLLNFVGDELLVACHISHLKSGKLFNFIMTSEEKLENSNTESETETQYDDEELARFEKLMKIGELSTIVKKCLKMWFTAYTPQFKHKVDIKTLTALKAFIKASFAENLSKKELLAVFATY